MKPQLFMNPQLSLQQSIENYVSFNDQITKELENTNNYSKITRLLVIDELLKRNLINYDFYKYKMKECNDEDKKDELKDLYYSLIISGTLMTLIFLFYLPSDKYYLFKLCYFLF